MITWAFRIQILWRMLLIASLTTLTVYILWQTPFFLSAIWTGLFAILLFVELLRYVEKKHREITYLLEAIEQNDFSVTFPISHTQKDKSDLRAVYNRILSTFRKLRSEREGQHQLLQTLVEQIAWGIICFNKKGEMVFTNQAARALFGKPEWFLLASLAREDRHLVELLETLPSGGREMYTYHHNGKRIVLSIHAITLKVIDQSLKLVTLQDISQELDAQELISWQKLIRVLMHEINNSVIPIATLSELSSDIVADSKGHPIHPEALDEDDLVDLYGNLKTIAGRSQGLVRFVEEYRHLTNVSPLSISTFEVKELIDRVITLLGPKINERDITYVVQIPAHLPLLEADLEKIEQVLINLINNAIDALEDRPHPFIRIQADTDSSNKLFLAVSDNGQGIPPPLLDSIFTPFFTTKSKGSGIGLSLTRQIMNMHKGNIEVQSTVGEGSIFYLRFDI